MIKAHGPVFDCTGIRAARAPMGGDRLIGLTAETIAALRGALAAGRVVLLRSFMERGWADEMRARAHGLLSGEGQSATKESSARESAGAVATVPDHGRVMVTAAAPGEVAQVSRIWLGFPWNPSPGGELAVAAALAELRAVVTNANEPAGEWQSVAAEISQFPRGGGHRGRLATARTTSDSMAGAEIVCFVALSQRGRDFNEGGLFVETAAGRVDVDGHLGLGDGCLFQTTLASEIQSIDPGKGRSGEPDWQHPGGRWALSASRQPALEIARQSLEERSRSTTSKLAPLSGPPSPVNDLAADDVTEEWCALLGIRQAGQRIGPAVVAALAPGEVRFQWPDGGASLGVSCRPARRGPAFCSSARYAIHYKLEGGRPLTRSEARFLHALCAATRAAESRRESISKR